MAKARKQKSTADAVYSAKSAKSKFSGAKKINPFEMHVNKEKFKILGRTCKHDKGFPGVSRGKAIQRRKETLGLQFRDKHKSNSFKDRRIGKNLDGPEPPEALMNARFLAEQMSHYKENKKSRFNLNEDEILTHRGQTLEEIEQFNDERSDQDDEEDEAHALDANYTEVAHFGGEDVANAKDRQTAIDEMILETKRQKAEIAKDKLEVSDLTAKLNSNLKELMPLLGKRTKNEIKEKPELNDYDRILREMVFEPRGTVTDKLLTDEEIAKKEKENLEKLENERQARMRGDDVKTQNKPNHRSADALDDCYFDGDEVINDDTTLRYTIDGNLIVGKHDAKEDDQDHEENESSNDNSSDENTEDESEEVSDDEEENNDEEDGDKKVEEDDEEKEDNSSGSEDDDDLSDLKVTDSEPETEVSTTKTATKVIKKQNDTPQIVANIPFTIEMPQTYGELKSLLSQHKPDDQSLIVERIIKCNHPKLDGMNREIIVKLFAFLIQYLNDLFCEATYEDVKDSFRILDKLNPHLFDLIHLNPEKISLCLLKEIQEKYTEYQKSPKIYPSLEILAYFKIVSNLFSTSDYRHKVVTPCYIFIHHILSKANVKCRQDIAMGLFLVTIILEFSKDCGRFLPSALNFILGIIYLSIPKRPIEVFKIVPPFMSTGYMNKILTFAETVSMEEDDAFLTSEDLVTVTLTSEFKVRALNTALRLAKDAISVMSNVVGANYLAEPFLLMIERLDLDNYPEFVRRNCKETKEFLSNVTSKPLTKLISAAKKPKVLRTLEARIEEVYDDKRRPKLSAKKEERAKLLHKVKRETKGAMREIRRDTAFLQRIRIDQQIKSDVERKEKVKRIYQEAAMQQGELNELARAKKKKKF